MKLPAAADRAAHNAAAHYPVTLAVLAAIAVVGGIVDVSRAVIDIAHWVAA